MDSVAYFFVCYKRVFMLSIPDNNQAEVIEAFSSSSRYLDDLLNIDTHDFEKKNEQKSNNFVIWGK